jgi:pyridoxal phosphate enzyme (YggS family)
LLGAAAGDRLEYEIAVFSDDIRMNLAAVGERIGRAAERAGRRAAGILLVAVSKTVAAERVRAAIAAGVPALGENRVQEARAKIEAIGRQVPWHLIGHLQTNKVRDAVACFDLIQSVDRLPLADALSRRAVAEARRIDVLVQVNVAEEAQKGGFPPADLHGALDAMRAMPGLRLRGLMTIPPLPEDPEDSRAHYRTLAKLLQSAQTAGLGPGFTELSMGMSGDFEVAVEEGATMVRVGTAVFGPRGDAPGRGR